MSLKSHKLFKDSVIIVGIKIFQAGIGLTTAWLITNLISTDVYGQYSFAISALIILGLLARFGLKGLSTYKIASFSNDDKTELSQYFLFSILVPIFVCLSIWGLVWLGYQYTHDEKVSLILFGMPILLLLSFLEINSGLLSGQKKVVLAQIIEFVLRPLLFLTFILATIFNSSSSAATSKHLLQFQVWALMVCVLLAFWFNRHLMQWSMLSRLNFSKYKFWLFQAIPYLMSNSGVIIYQQLGVVFAGWYLTNESTAAYRIADQISTLLAFGLHALNSVLSPYVASANDKHKMDYIQTQITKMTWGLSAGVVIAFCIFMAFADNLLAIFSLKSSPTYITCFIILSVGQLFNVFCGTNGMVLNMTGNAKFNARWSYVAVLLNLILLVILAPTFGLIGIASAMAISRIFWNISLVIEAKKRTGLNTTIVAKL